MTPAELLAHAQTLGVTLHPAPDGLKVVAPTGTMTPALLAALRTAKADLVALLTPAQAPAHVLPDFREWRTGRTPSSALTPMKAPLPAPRHHDRPSPPRVYTGRPCEKKACKGSRARFWPTRMCTRCWERAKKITNTRETPE
jgi:hypothetical protein